MLTITTLQSIMIENDGYGNDFSKKDMDIEFES